MLIVFGFALLVLAIGMVVLFAMLGELSSRVTQTETPARNTEIVPMDNVRLGHIAEAWPDELPAVPDGLSTLLVLASTCTSCEDIAAQLREDPGHVQWSRTGIVLSTASRLVGQDFISSYGLGKFPHYVDEGGKWVSGEFGVQSSPAALVLEDGQLVAAYIFHDVNALQAKLSQLAAQHAQEQHREAV